MPEPTGAQIPLPAFHLPEIPPEAANLTHLTLTSDIKPTDYASLLANPVPSDAIPRTLPQGIESLALELFSLGYPAPFLTSLGKSLPRLKALTVYSQLIDGVSEASRADAGEFMYDLLLRGLQELHLLDAFCRKGFLAGLGQIMDEDAVAPADEGKKKGGMRFLEVSYTYRGHSDKDFLARVPGEELPALLASSLVAASLKLAPAADSQDADTGLGGEIPSDPADVDENGNRIPGEKPQGIIPFASRYPGTTLLVEKLTRSESGLKLKLLDCTLYTLSVTQLEKILGFQSGLAVLGVSLLVRRDEKSKTSLLDTIRSGGKSLEMVEVVGVPDEEEDEDNNNNNNNNNNINDEGKKNSVFHGIFPTVSDMETLAKDLPNLESFSMNILCAPKFGSVQWKKSDNGSWTGGVSSI